MTTPFVARSHSELAEASTENRPTVGELLLCALVPWALFGHQLMVLLAVRLQLPTRDLTILGRGITVALAMLTIAVVALRSGNVLKRIAPMLLLAFWTVYMIRIGLEADLRSLGAADSDRQPLSYFIQMGLGACFLPSLAVLSNTSWLRHKTVRKYCIALACASGAIMLATYGSQIANFDGRWASKSQVGGFFAVHPLALGHLGAVLIGFSLYFCCCLRGRGIVPRWTMALALCTMGVVLIVGSASRGPILSLIVAGVVVLGSLARRREIGRATALVAAAICLVVAIFIYANVTGSILLNRLSGIQRGIEAQSSDTDRLELYDEAFTMFLDSPILGSSPTLPGRDEHPHNLFLESLMATGLAGTIPFALLVGLTIRAAWQILIRRPELGWVPILFFLHFMAGMFSFSIYANVSFWLSLATTLSCREWLRQEELSITAESTGTTSLPEQLQHNPSYR